jgi:hypothetical protein
MKKHLSKIILGTELLAALLILGAVFIWAPVCSGLLTLQNGTLVHMKCFYTAQASIVLALILVIAAIAAFFSKTDHNKIHWVIIVIGIMIIANTYDSIIGIGICKKVTMECHTTAVWLKVGAALAIISGLLDIFANSSKTNKLTL